MICVQCVHYKLCDRVPSLLLVVTITDCVDRRSCVLMGANL